MNSLMLGQSFILISFFIEKLKHLTSAQCIFSNHYVTGKEHAQSENKLSLQTWAKFLYTTVIQ